MTLLPYAIGLVALVGWYRSIDQRDTAAQERDEAKRALKHEQDATKKARARTVELQDMNDVLADCIVRLVDQLETKERDPLGLGFHEPPMRIR